MIENQKQRGRGRVRRLWQTAFALLLAGVLAVGAAPQLSASALYLITDGLSTVVTGKAERVSADRIVLTGAESTDTDMILEANRKVQILHSDGMQYATSRSGESVSDLLKREGISVGPLEMVRLDVTGEDILMEIASDFTYYETVSEAAAYSTVYTTDYTIPKGETVVRQEGVNGTQDVTYEVVYADGAFVSRQAVAETNNNSKNRVVSTGTLVKTAREGDTIAHVIRNDDGSGYLIMKSGDSLHFTHTMDIRCTAYTTGEPGVGTITYTGTRVHVGVVAVDKSVIPLGSTMFITTANGDFTYGMSHAEDTGVHGRTVDLYMNSLSECNRFGVRSSIAYFLDD